MVAIYTCFLVTSELSFLRLLCDGEQGVIAFVCSSYVDVRPCVVE